MNEIDENELKDSTLNILKASAKKIRKGWVKNIGAVDRNGNEVDAADPQVTRFCLVEALARSTDEQVPVGGNPIYQNAIKCLHEDEIITKSIVGLGFHQSRVCDLTQYNDTQKKKQPVIDLLKRTISKLESGV